MCAYSKHNRNRHIASLFKRYTNSLYAQLLINTKHTTAKRMKETNEQFTFIFTRSKNKRNCAETISAIKNNESNSNSKG